VLSNKRCYSEFQYIDYTSVTTQIRHIVSLPECTQPVCVTGKSTRRICWIHRFPGSPNEVDHCSQTSTL